MSLQIRMLLPVLLVLGTVSIGCRTADNPAQPTQSQEELLRRETVKRNIERVQERVIFYGSFMARTYQRGPAAPPLEERQLANLPTYVLYEATKSRTVLLGIGGIGAGRWFVATMLVLREHDGRLSGWNVVMDETNGIIERRRILDAHTEHMRMLDSENRMVILAAEIDERTSAEDLPKEAMAELLMPYVNFMARIPFI